MAGRLNPFATLAYRFPTAATLTYIACTAGGINWMGDQLQRYFLATSAIHIEEQGPLRSVRSLPDTPPDEFKYANCFDVDDTGERNRREKIVELRDRAFGHPEALGGAMARYHLAITHYAPGSKGHKKLSYGMRFYSALVYGERVTLDIIAPDKYPLYEFCTLAMIEIRLRLLGMGSYDASASDNGIHVIMPPDEIRADQVDEWYQYVIEYFGRSGTAASSDQAYGRLLSSVSVGPDTASIAIVDPKKWALYKTSGMSRSDVNRWVVEETSKTVKDAVVGSQNSTPFESAASGQTHSPGSSSEAGKEEPKGPEPS